VDSFIPHLPELKRLIETFSRTLFEKETSWAKLRNSQLVPQSKPFPTRLLGSLKKPRKIWKYGRLWNLFEVIASGHWFENWSCYRREAHKRLNYWFPKHVYLYSRIFRFFSRTPYLPLFKCLQKTHFQKKNWPTIIDELYLRIEKLYHRRVKLLPV